jgi:hypothetical protein
VESHQLLKELFGVFADCLRFYSVLEFNHKSIGRVLDIFDEKTCMRRVIQRQFGYFLKSLIICRIRSPFLRFLNLGNASGERESFLSSISFIFLSHVVSIIPQLEDYMCIVCMDLAFKPGK